MTTLEDFVRRAQAAQEAVDQLLPPTEPMYVIWSIEHEAWWRAGWMGYTRELAEAGRYSLPAATEVLARANYVAVNECAIPVACVEPSRK